MLLSRLNLLKILEWRPCEGDKSSMQVPAISVSPSPVGIAGPDRYQVQVQPALHILPSQAALPSTIPVPVGQAAIFSRNHSSSCWAGGLKPHLG